ncbi:MAG: sugar transferase [Bacteroidaceae bacterium]|nr:sugar transferase [Bacteroidaceae bacterium]
MIQQTTLDIEITDGMSRAERGVKRCFDVVFALLGLILLSPLFLIIFVLLKVKSSEPVFFSQERIGYGARPFRILKFRTMVSDIEEGGVPMLAQRDDPRLLPLGRFLREYHLDELPQLWNILCGEMSFVGPRPERQYFIDQILRENSDYRYIFRMRPGATSMATLYNGYTDTLDKMLIRLQMDLDYYQKRSLAVDARILGITAKYIIFSKKF